MPVRTFYSPRCVPSIPGARTTPGGIVLASARAAHLRAAPSRASSPSRSTSRAGQARFTGHGSPASQHDAGARYEETHTEVDAVLELQHAYGNQAVAQLLATGAGGAPPVVPSPGSHIGNRALGSMLVAQRAPNDDDSGATSYPAGDATSYPAGDATSYPADSSGPRSSGPKGGGSADADTEAADLVMLPDPKVIVPVGGGSGGAPAPQKVGLGEAGGVDQVGRARLVVTPHAVTDGRVRKQFREDPSSVFRSPSVNFHNEMWRQMRTDDQPDEPPVAFAAGRLVAVHPRYRGPATSIPGSYSGKDDPVSVAAKVETLLDYSAPKPGRALGNAVAPPTGGVPGFGGTPGFVPGPQGPGRQTAQAVSTPDVLAAMKQNPTKVWRSPSTEWHDQMFGLDKGKGSTTPTAYRVGDIIVIAPNNPIKGVPTLAIPSGPGAAGTSAPPAAPTATATATGGAAAPASPTSTRRVKGDITSTKGKPGVAGEVMVVDETVKGDTTTKRARGGTAGALGGNVASIGGQSTTTTTTGDAATATKTAGNLTLRPDGGLVLGGERTRETSAGRDAAGEPIKTGATSTTGNLGLSEKGLTGQVGKTRTTQGGTKHGGSATGTIDADGNASGQLAYKVETKRGTSLTPSVSGGVSVQASDPIPAEGGGFDVTYTVTTSSGVGLAAGKQLGGGPSVGVQLGTTSASLETGSKHFDDEKQAQAFRDKAATVIAQERLFAKPPTTVEGALQIKIGEERGSGEMSGSSIGGSVAFEGASLGYGKAESTTHQFKVRRISERLFHVTGSVSGTKGSDVTGSGGITLTKGSSETRAFEVVWEFDLGSRQGRDAFERYATTGLPQIFGATIKSMTSSGSEEDHDNVSVPLLGTARWTGTTWEIIKTDPKGGRKAQFGGQKAHKQEPSWIGENILGQDKLSSSAQITSHLEGDGEGGEQESYEAEVKVSSDSGDYNRKQFGEIFMGVPTTGDVKPSGEWTLTAQISPDVVRELEKLNKEMRNAWSKEDVMRAYSKLVKERGARMVGGQVARGGDANAWTLELKGDKNFPGQAGRAALDARRTELRGKLKDAAAAKAVVSDAQKTLDELRARRIAVADKERYTDLPDGLRDQQLKLIDKHITDFEFIRHHGLRRALKREAGASKTDAAKVGAGQPDAGAAGGYKGNNEAAESADMLKLRAAIDEKETAISALDPRISRGINAVTQASTHYVNVSPVYAGWVLEHRAAYNEHWTSGIAINDRQFAMARTIDGLRQKLLESLFAVDRKAAAEALLAQLTDRLALLQTLHIHVVACAEALKPITTKKGMKGYPRYWGSIKGDEPPWADRFGSSED